MLKWCVVTPLAIFAGIWLGLRLTAYPVQAETSVYDLLAHNEPTISHLAGRSIPSNIRYRAYFLPLASKRRYLAGMKQYFGHARGDTATIYSSAFITLANHRYFNVACWIKPDMSTFCVMVFWGSDEGIDPVVNRAVWEW